MAKQTLDQRIKALQAKKDRSDKEATLKKTITDSKVALAKLKGK